MSETFKRRLAFVIEALAVLLSLVYTFRYINAERDCFFYGMAGAALFVYLCVLRKIYAEAFLQLFYVGFGVYGFVNWDYSASPPNWGWVEHGVGIAVCAFLMVALARMLPKFTDTQAPWLDAFTTVFSLWATWVMVQFIHENWLYWLVIDTVAVVLYARRGLYLGAALFALYGVMAASAYFEWGWFVW